MKTITAVAAFAGVVSLIGWSVEQKRSANDVTQQMQRDERAQALRALDRLERQLATLRPTTGVVMQLREGTSDEVERLQSRVHTIRAKVDSLGEDVQSRRGAWAGVRANIADLEYRTDIALLTAQRGAREFRSEFHRMLDETDAQIGAVQESLTPQARLDHGARLDGMLEELRRLRRETADVPVDEPGLATSRDAWARRLATLRRELRAIARSLDTGKRATEREPRRSGSNGNVTRRLR